MFGHAPPKIRNSARCAERWNGNRKPRGKPPAGCSWLEDVGMWRRDADGKTFPHITVKERRKRAAEQRAAQDAVAVEHGWDGGVASGSRCDALRSARRQQQRALEAERKAEQQARDQRLEEMRKARAAEVSFAMVWTPNPQQGQCHLARLDVVDALEDALNHPPRRPRPAMLMMHCACCIGTGVRCWRSWPGLNAISPTGLCSGLSICASWHAPLSPHGSNASSVASSGAALNLCYRCLAAQSMSTPC